MTIANTQSELPSFAGRIAFVPTMGALHAGHISLIHEAKKHADHVVASIFVNPAQFGPNEDLSRYPRTLEADLAALKAAGCHAVYTPTPYEIYPEGFDTSIRVGKHEHMLCGLHRPGHFAGVATVVAKLFNMVRPHAALFGEKDFQQLTLIKQLVRDLNMNIEIIGVPTMRESDGLAMSSRNRYLNESERKIAVQMHATLQQVRTGLLNKTYTPHEVSAQGTALLLKAGFTKVDYVELRDTKILEPVTEKNNGEARLLAAAWLNSTRLIDNIPL